MTTPDLQQTAVVSLTVVTDRPDHVVRASEVFARAAAGLTLEGVNVSLHFSVEDDDEDSGS